MPFPCSYTTDDSPAVILSVSTAQNVGSERQSSLLVLFGGCLIVYPKEASSTVPHQSFSLAEHHVELVRDAEEAPQGMEEDGGGQSGTAARGGGEELVLRVTVGKPVQSVGSVLVGMEHSDPLSSWTLPVTLFAPSPEGAQVTTWEEGPTHHGSGSLGSSLQLAPTRDRKEVLFIFCSESTATHLLTLVRLTQLHFTHGPTFFFTA